eukprot:2094291-Pyramimonas_sp.AAC.1
MMIRRARRMSEWMGGAGEVFFVMHRARSIAQHSHKGLNGTTLLPFAAWCAQRRKLQESAILHENCLLYTSDAADDTPC